MSMTVEEAKEYIVNECRNTNCKYLNKDNECMEDGKCFEVKFMAIQALEEIQAYRAIGTIEDFKALKEKNEPKKVTLKNESEIHIDFMCPNCNEGVYRQPYKPNYCKHCGQKLDWQ